MSALPDLNTVRAKLAFECVHEAASLPPLHPDADQLFRYARHLQKVIGPKNYDEMARYYRIAAAHDHFKANRNLQLLVSRKQATSPDAPNESIDLATRLVEQGIPGGYFDIAYYLTYGYGLTQDSEMALRYYRKAADLGSPEAQFHVADLLAPQDKAPDVAGQMLRCATDQGHGGAARSLGFDLKLAKRYGEATEAFQKSTKAGNSNAAGFLESAFNTPDASEELYYLALAVDLERVRRYKLIGKFLDRHEGRNPKLPDIDKIVPLPPAKLPPWDETFEWEKAYEAEMASPPPKPSDELIARLCKAKNLDPATGLPIPPPPRKPLGTRVQSGERCPETGVWCVGHLRYVLPEATRTLREGDTMPQLVLYDPRRLELLDHILGMRRKPSDREWTLIAYEEKKP